MKKYFFILLILFLLTLTSCRKNDSSSTDIYEIYSINDLFNMKNNLDGDYLLKNDLDLSGYLWTPIGNEENPFTGTFNGNNYKIINLTVSNQSRYIGLFGYSYNAELSNVIFEKVKYDYKCGYSNNGIINYYIGTITGFAHNTKIEYVTVNSIYNEIDLSGVHSKYFLGGIVGECTSSCTISNCINYSNLKGMNIVGGIVGLVYASNEYSTFKVSNCSNYGNIRAISDEDYPEVNSYAGGIIGCITMDFEIKECSNFGIISAFTVYGTNTQSYAENIIGRIYGNVNIKEFISCESNGEVYLEKGTHEHIFYGDSCYCGEK